MLRQLLFLGIVLLVSGQKTGTYFTDAPKNASQQSVRPIIYMHGLNNDVSKPCFAKNYIPTKVPGAVVYPIDMYNGAMSLVNLNRQLSYIIPAMKKIMDNHRDTGVTLLCYSQGGVICRAVVQMMSTHNVHTLITLSSPLAGQYGVTSYVERIMSNTDRKYMWEFWYSWEGQGISIGNYWNDPHQQQAFSDPEQDVLLARLNNQTGHTNSDEYRENFKKLRQLVLIGGPNDTVITPWQSAHFGFYDETETVQPFEKLSLYADDGFGLRSLHEDGKVVRHVYPGVGHIEWWDNPDVYDCCVIPYL